MKGTSVCLRLLLPFLACWVSFSGGLSAQCTPNYADSSYGVRPLVLPQGCVSQPYTAVVQFVLPVDTVVFGFTLPFDSMELMAPIGLPPGLTMTYDSPTGWYYPPSSGRHVFGCGTITGVPTAGNQLTDSINIVVRYKYTAPFTTTDFFDSNMVHLFVAQPPTPSFTWAANAFTVTFSNTSATYPTFYWDFGDGDTSHQWSPTHTYATIGNFNACLMIGEAPCTTQTCQTVVTTAIGLDDRDLPRLGVQPNPVVGSSRVEFERLRSSGELQVWNVMGQLMMRLPVAAGDEEAILPGDRLPNGTYWVGLHAGAVHKGARIEVLH